MSRKETISTEYSFTLPCGLSDAQNRVHRQGKMRLATAIDEISVQKHQQVQDNSAYSSLFMLAQVITRLGSLTSVTPKMLEGLVLRDIAYLREFYNQINQSGQAHIPTQCPHCNSQFAVEFALAGES